VFAAGKGIRPEETDSTPRHEDTKKAFALPLCLCVFVLNIHSMSMA
jgi:hypothetical protein